MAAFLQDDAFRDREPQRFGMVSFTQLSVAQASEHRQAFGPFGVAVSWGWARRHQAQRVLYVAHEGPVFETWQFLFQSALRDLKARASQRPDGWWHMSIHNKAMANVMGATGWATLLSFYEYMQTDADAPQVEWRIVQQLPFNFDSDHKAEQIKQALQLASTWKTSNLALRPYDVPLLVSPEARSDELRAQLPAPFRNVRGITYPGEP